MRAGLMRLAGNLILLAASAGITWLLIEAVFFPTWVHRLPLRLHEWIVNSAVRTLAQSSKAAALPERYVALVGDSYAAGEGDWRLTVDAGRNPPTHSAHLIQAATGRDVVTFGHAGAGSLRGIVTEPITRVDYLAVTWRFAIEDPDEILVYFHAGNDLDDNLEDLAQRYDDRFEPGRPRGRRPDPAQFARFLDEVALGESELGRKRREFRASDNLFVARSLRWVAGKWLASRALPRAGSRTYPALDALPRAQGPHSVVEVGGQRLETPIPLQGPAPQLDAEETETALWVFEKSLERAAERFERSHFRVLYVPSALLVYRLGAGRELVQEDHARLDRPRVIDSSVLRARSDALCTDVSAIAARHGLPFRDARPALREAAANRFLHGPRDWKHLNRAGYEVLAGEAVELLRLEGSGQPCS